MYDNNYDTCGKIVEWSRNTQLLTGIIAPFPILVRMNQIKRQWGR